MKRFASTIVTLVVIANVLPMNALAACGHGGGGYRGPSRPFYGPVAPIYRPAPLYHQPVVRQQYAPRPVISQPTFRPISTQPQIRIAPSQRAQVRMTQPTQVRAPQPAQVRAPQPAIQSAPQVPQTTTPQNDSNVNSALAILAGQQAPAAQSAPTATPQTATAALTTKYVGTWTATVDNNASIRLSLQANGSFNWVATKNGKESRFDGQFTIAGGTLTLARASDNQKLTGSMTFSGNGFNFKLNGTKDAGLNFTQQS